jgi:hypothetical protein
LYILYAFRGFSILRGVCRADGSEYADFAYTRPEHGCWRGERASGRCPHITDSRSHHSSEYGSGHFTHDDEFYANTCGAWLHQERDGITTDAAQSGNILIRSLYHVLYNGSGLESGV